MRFNKLFYKKLNLKKRIIIFSILLFTSGCSKQIPSNSWKVFYGVNQMSVKPEYYFTRTIKSGEHEFKTKLTCDGLRLDGFTRIKGKDKGLFAQDLGESMLTGLLIGRMNINLDGKYFPYVAFERDRNYSNTFYLRPLPTFDFKSFSEIFSAKTVKLVFPIMEYGPTIFTWENEIDPWVKVHSFCEESDDSFRLNPGVDF